MSVASPQRTAVTDTAHRWRRYGLFAEEYFKLFDKTGKRPDQDGDRGLEYRNLVGIPGGSASPLAKELVEASIRQGDKMDFAKGKGDDPDIRATVFVMDTAKHPFFVGEAYHQFHDGFAWGEDCARRPRDGRWGAEARERWWTGARRFSAARVRRTNSPGAEVCRRGPCVALRLRPCPPPLVPPFPSLLRLREAPYDPTRAFAPLLADPQSYNSLAKTVAKAGGLPSSSCPNGMLGVGIAGL